MRPTIFVKPKSGLIVRCPDGKILPPDGAEVARASWWTRREREGDVTVITEKDSYEKGGLNDGGIL
ncbi:DUF2635 domain-containing protein [Cloacibacillus evryensis]|mgnify:FL=1|uniref:DUF2635 domain-containing protein n=1 Tax=Cloacibacillus evryensis TaxID=508460 RepID=UPI00210E2526|nr:DUF2635 domain-containing protein [Cloacibacillus evryensis]MCQ4765030.1 DUF2635 domain-containing protein [Cloacibacillus evryensis]